MDEPVHLKEAGAEWWHSDDHASPSLRKSSLGEFFFVVLSEGAHVGYIWPFNHKFSGSGVYVSIYATDAQRQAIEGKTRFRFRRPPKINVNSAQETARDDG